MGKYLIPGIISACLILSGLFTNCAVLDPPEDEPVDSDLENLVVTEIHYHPFSEDSALVDKLEFIEMHNIGESEISLENVVISDGIDFMFTSNAKIGSGEYLVLASDGNEFERRYGLSPHGEYSGQLKNSGERIAFKDLESQKDFIIIEYTDLPPWPTDADGDGYSMVPVSDSTFEDYSNGALWRKSFKIHGSPGKHDPGPVYINEIMPHTDPPKEDAIELYNPNVFPVDVSGWYLTDSEVDPMKFRIPNGSVIDANGYIVFYSSQFDNSSLPYPFALSENGEEVYLFSDSMGIDCYSYGFSFDAVDNGVTYGRYVNSVGKATHCVLQKATLGEENSGPMLSDVVITEIMYNPPEGKSEYLEIKNISSATVYLYDQNNPHNTWNISGFDVQFPQNVSIKSNEVILITNDTVPEETFRTAYNVPEGVQIFSIASGKLSNSGEKISLMVPVKPDSGGTEVYYKEVEKVKYKDDDLWSALADGNGSSLVRKDLDQFADDPANWKAGTPTPGE